MSDNPVIGYDPNADVYVAIRAARDAIQEALGYIERQEDGPLTMRHALCSIDEQVDRIETEASILRGTVARLTELATNFHEQRNQAMLQRDLALALLAQMKA